MMVAVPTHARYVVTDNFADMWTSALLEPFRYSHYAEGGPHPVSNSPFPWS